MTERNSHETHHIYPNLNSLSLHAVPLNDQQHFRLNKIKEIKDYFIVEKLNKENYWAKGLVNTLPLLTIFTDHWLFYL